MKSVKHPRYLSLSTKTGSRKHGIVVFMTFLCLSLPMASSYAAEIQSVNVKLLNNDIYVSTSVGLDPKAVSEISDGLSKELVFYLDLFRVWEVWPDEFVTGKKITRTLRSNPIKREYTAVSIDGNIYLEKRFKDLTGMLGWALNITDMKLTNIRELEAGVYFVKVGVESRMRTLPPVIGYFLFFVPEKEFSVYRNSQTFSLGAREAP